MNDTLRIPELLQWSEGMLLSPQHFQQNDIYYHTLLRHLMSQIQPNYWGLLDLKLDDAAVRAGKVHVRAVHAVMPDGLVVQYPAPGQEDTLALDVTAEAAVREGRPVRVHLAVPVRAEGAASRASSIQRYDSVNGTLVMDENTGEGLIEVCRLRPRLTLIAGDQVPAKYVAIPLLELRRDLGGHFDLTDFHPPMLRLSASSFLGEAAMARRLELLATRIRAKAKELAGVTDADSSPAITNTYQRAIVRQLVAALPYFEVHVRGGASHPFETYAALAQIVGQIAGVNGDPIPLLFDAYRHDDAAPAFLKAIRHITSVLAKLNAAYDAVAFEHPQEHLFTFGVAPNARTERLLIELKPQAGQTPPMLAQWLNQATIGSAAAIPMLRRRRLPGARVRPLPPEQVAALGVSSGNLFEIVNQPVEQDDRLVPVIQAGAPLHILGTSDLAPPAAVILYTPNQAANKKPAPTRPGNHA